MSTLEPVEKRDFRSSRGNEAQISRKQSDGEPLTSAATFGTDFNDPGLLLALCILFTSSMASPLEREIRSAWSDSDKRGCETADCCSPLLAERSSVRGVE